MADMEMTTATTNAAEPSDKKTSRLRKRDICKYVPDRDSVGDIRNSLLVVSALISAATFAVGVNPPGGVWQDDEATHVAVSSVSPPGNIKTRYVYLALFLPYMLRAAFEVIKRIWKLLAGNK